MHILKLIFAPILNTLIDLVYIITVALTFLLPDSPFQFEPVDWGIFGKAIGTVFPVGQMATHLTLILSAYLTYYGIRHLLRLVKQVR